MMCDRRAFLQSIARMLLLFSFALLVTYILVGGQELLFGFTLESLNGMVMPFLLAELSASIVVMLASSSSQQSAHKQTTRWWAATPVTNRLYWGTQVFVVLPLLVRTIGVSAFFITSVPDVDPLPVIANFAGIVSLPAMAVFLVPVTKYSKILQAWGWSPPDAIKGIHVSLGWFAFWAGTLHSVLYLYYWLDKHIAFTSLLSSVVCVVNPEYIIPNCDHHSCTCRTLMYYLTGLVAFGAFLMIAVSSTHWVRRHYYSLFYKIHILMAPLAFFVLCMHWPMVIDYLMGAVLVYVASVFASMMDLRSRPPVQIVSVDRIPGNKVGGSDAIVAFTVSISRSAAVSFRAGQYIQLTVPHISPISHAFTVVAGAHSRSNEEQLQDHSTFRQTMTVIFRPVGSFTKALGRSFETSLKQHHSRTITLPQDGSSSSPISIPRIYLDGFRGGADRLEEMRHHDHICMIAGGVGVTPFLTMISMALDQCKQQEQLASGTGDESGKKCSLTLHWACRERAFVRHVKKRFYTEDWQIRSASSNVSSLHVMIHATGGAVSRSASTIEAPVQCEESMVLDTSVPRGNGTNDIVENPGDDSKNHMDSPPDVVIGLPFVQSHLLHSPIAILALVCGVGVGIPMSNWVVTTLQVRGGSVLNRLYAPAIMMLWTACIAVAAHVLPRSLSITWRKYYYQGISSTDDDGDHVPLSTPTDFEDAVQGGQNDYSSPPERRDISNTEENMITWTEVEGRPDVPDIISSLEGGSGVFCCGPMVLLDQIQGSIRRQNRQCDADQKISLYVETFEI